jgi:hypothetical protein
MSVARLLPDSLFHPVPRVHGAVPASGRALQRIRLFLACHYVNLFPFNALKINRSDACVSATYSHRAMVRSAQPSHKNAKRTVHPQ